MVENILGKNIRDLRKELGLTQEECGDKLDITGGYVSDIERGKAIPKDSVFQRIVPLHKDFLKLLRAWHKLDRADKKKPETIVSYRGRQIASIKTAWKNAKDLAGITRKLRPYDLRHAFATRALKSGADVKSTSELLGHSRPDTTMRIYQHTDIEMHRKVIAKIPALKVPKK